MTSLPPQTKKTHKVEADVGTQRQIATRLKTALQDGSWQQTPPHLILIVNV